LIVLGVGFGVVAAADGRCGDGDDGTPAATVGAGEGGAAMGARIGDAGARVGPGTGAAVGGDVGARLGAVAGVVGDPGEMLSHFAFWLVALKHIPAAAPSGIMIVNDRPAGVLAFICIPGSAPYGILTEI
jgi:hypothetical protein